ncbi:hypothetical protein TCAP_01945 [Tolypocladium capitatum]|uniref:Uncharacterized protein n=1 Tax=Tolypocladium capitatum TaxID=45235 RepID=A0A2K3QKT1_9HYPO|nr:hypothetical protein TCAP_01945 [Tolypocladium capitatum]
MARHWGLPLTLCRAGGIRGRTTAFEPAAAIATGLGYCVCKVSDGLGRLCSERLTPSLQQDLPPQTPRPAAAKCSKATRTT